MPYSPDQLRRVDALIAEVLGWTEVRHMYAREVELTGVALQVDDLVGCPSYGHGPSHPVPFFTLEPSAAYLAIDWLRARWQGKLRSVVTTDDKGTTCQLIALTGHGTVGYASSDTPALAMCFAVLKERGLVTRMLQVLDDLATI